MDYLLFPAILLTGFLTKLTDLVADEGLEMPRTAEYASGIIYGILIAYVIASCPPLAPLWLAVVISVIVTKKIDSAGHALGMGATLLFIGIWGLPGVDVTLMLIFLAAGVADEAGNDMADKGRLKGRKAKFLRKRLLLELTAFLVSVVTWEWVIFFGMIVFDAGYVATGKLGKHR